MPDPIASQPLVPYRFSGTPPPPANIQHVAFTGPNPGYQNATFAGAFNASSGAGGMPLGMFGAGMPPAPAGGGGGPINYMASLGSAGRPSPSSGQGVLPGAPPYNYDPRFGGVPGVPSPQGTQAAAIGGNISALGPIYQLGQGLNQFTAQQAPTSLNLNLPHYQGMIGQSSGNILSKLQGQIPQDVARQLQQFGAERGVATGSIGGPNANAATLRALGLTSLDLQNQGENQLTQAIGRTPQGAQFNPASFLVSPQDQQQAQYQANLLNAVPVPSSAQFAGLNAFQQGRGSGFGGGFPSSAPSSAPYSPYSPGQPAMGSTPYGPHTGAGTLTSYSSEPYGPPNSFQPGDFESMFPDLGGGFQPGDFESMFPDLGGGFQPGDFESMFGDGG